MTDPKQSTATKSALTYVRRSARSTPNFSAAMSAESDGPVLGYVLDYLAHHPHDRERLGEALQAMLPMGTDDNRAKGHFGPWFRAMYPQGGVGLQTTIAASKLTDTQPSELWDFRLLEAHRSDVASLARFSQRVDYATFYLLVAVDHFANRLQNRGGMTMRRRPKSWYSELAHQCFGRWKTIRNLLMHDWPLPDASEPLYRTAFWSLCELTPASSQLKLMFENDRFRASQELVRHVDACAEQLALTADLAQTMAKEERGAADDPKARLDTIQQVLLEQGGARLTLTEAASRLGITRQAMHKRIRTKAALGLMIGEAFVVPATQMVETVDGVTVVPGLRDVLLQFREAGAGDWSALQYLVEPDPALGGAAPLDRLKDGDVQTVVAGARAYLGLDEG